MTEPLKITTLPRSDRQLDLTIELGPERTEEALHRAARAVTKRVNIPGFRRGKAPYGTVLRQFGRDALLNEVLDDLSQEVYKEALDIEKIEPYSKAQVTDVELNPPTFKLVVPLPPEVDLGDYRSVRVEATEIVVTDADVDQVLEQQRANRTTAVEIDRPAELGDTVTLDIHGMVGEDTIMDNHDWDLVLKEEAGWLPGFAEAFVSMREGDQKAFTLRYPEESSSRYKGQEASFQATMKAVKARLEPELNDDFARSLGDYQDMADLRAKVREQLVRQRTAEAENKLNDAALEAVIAQAHLEYPPAAVETTVEDMIEDARRNVARSGYSLEDALRLQGITLEEYHEQLHPQAEKRLQGRLVLNKLAQVEKIQVAPEEVAAEIDRMAPVGDEQTGDLREALDSSAGRLVVQQDVLTEKTLQRLRDIVTGKAPELAGEVEPEEAAAAATVAGAPSEAAGEVVAADVAEEPSPATTSAEA